MTKTLLHFLKEHGFADYFDPDLSGRMQRFDRNGKNNCYFWGIQIPPNYIRAVIGDYKTNEKYEFEDFGNLSSEDKENLKGKINEATKKYEEEKAKEYETAAAFAQERWDELEEGSSHYLIKKGIVEITPADIGLKTSTNNWGENDLHIPLKDIKGKIWGVQKVQSDGEKIFQSGAKKQGNFFPIGQITTTSKKIYIAEGIATAISIWIATKETTLCAFDANNLYNVALEVRKAFPKIPIIICGDNDRFTIVNDEYRNVGKLAAQKAAGGVNGIYILPEFTSPSSVGTDFNDLHQEEGIDAVRKQLLSVATPTAQDIIPTLKTGFHHIEETKNKTIYKPAYDDLRKYFDKVKPYKTMGGSKICYSWTGKFYREYQPAYLEAFAQNNFFPYADTKKCQEFKNLVNRTNLTDPDWFESTTVKKVNFANGVLDLKTMELLPHSPERGFKYVLTYNYDASAQCPVFDKFLDDVTLQDKDIQKVILEFIGYTVSNDKSWLQKALVLEGIGSNGKSTLMLLIRELIGQDNCSAYTISDLSQEKYTHSINGKLLNMTEETPSKALLETSTFKLISGGGTISARPLYSHPYTYEVKTKLIFACNEMPRSFDTSYGLIRRLLIVPFKAEFTDEKKNKDIDIDSKLHKELPGIFNRAMAAYKECIQRKKMTESKVISKAIHVFERENDFTLAWLENNVVVHALGNGHDDSFQTISELYTCYAEQIEKDGLKPLSKIYFGKKLGRYIKDYDSRIKKRRVQNRVERVITGISRISEEEF